MGFLKKQDWRLSNMKRYTVDDSINITEYSSMGEFLRDINSLPNNKFYQHINESQRTGNQNWSGTSSYKEALELSNTGWTTAATKMATKVKMTASESHSARTSKPVYSIVGSQACVPLYLQGVPTNMCSRKTLYTKQKVVTVTKGISYNFGWKTEDMIDEGTKSIQIIQSMENGGLRVKLNVLFSVTHEGETNTCKVCIKQPDERISISKMAFALSHPSMLRRLMLKWVEVDPYSKKSMGINYGTPSSLPIKRKAMGESEYYLEEHIGDINQFISSILK